MKVDLIRTEFQAFASTLLDGVPESSEHKHALVARFQEHWSLENLNLMKMYEKCFSSDFSRVLWGESKYSARESMTVLLKEDPHFGRTIFRDLFNNGKDVSLRISRFIDHCDSFCQDLKRTQNIWLDHHHDVRQITLYLALSYPEEYTLFDFEIFSAAMKLLGVRRPPASHEVVRFFNLSKSLYRMIREEEDIMKPYSEHIANFIPSTMVVHDFYLYLGSREISW